MTYSNTAGARYTRKSLWQIPTHSKSAPCIPLPSWLHGEGPVRSVRVLTGFHSAPKATSAVTVPCPSTEPVVSTESAKQTARAKAEADAKLLAQKIATQLNVSISFYKIEKLHDRFLLVGERLWHVGCSFNTLGQEISAVIEMRDERAKSAVLDIFERAMSQTPVFEVKP